MQTVWNLDAYVWDLMFIGFKRGFKRGEKGGRHREGWTVLVCWGASAAFCGGFFFFFFFVMMHYSFSSGTHGKVFTEPSAKIARLNWADVQLLRKWMLFKGGQPVLHTCQCKRTQSPSRCLPLSSSLYACVSEAHQSHVRSVPASKNTPIIQCSVICCSFVYFGLYCTFEPSVRLTLCYAPLLEITIKLLKMIQAELVSRCGSALREASRIPARSKTWKKKRGARCTSAQLGTSTSRWLWLL